MQLQVGPVGMLRIFGGFKGHPVDSITRVLTFAMNEIFPPSLAEIIYSKNYHRYIFNYFQSKFFFLSIFTYRYYWW